MPDASFWSEGDDRHKKIAKTYYQHIDYDHPDYITSDGQGDRICYHCKWSASSVKYPTYNGPRVTKIS